jgi:DNA-binding Lrp family transcriptional regulator
MTVNSLDQIDRKMILYLEDDPGLTDADLARKLNLAQSTVATRYRKLVEAEIIVPNTRLSAKRLGLETGIVQVTTTRPDLVMEWANKCPLFVNSFRTVAGNHIGLIFVAEDSQTFHNVVDEHLLKIEGIIDFNFSNILEWNKGFFAPLDLTITSRDSPPCGMSPFCSKCPANPNYSGKVWNTDRPDGVGTPL